MSTPVVLITGGLSPASVAPPPSPSPRRARRWSLPLRGGLPEALSQLSLRPDAVRGIRDQLSLVRNVRKGSPLQSSQSRRYVTVNERQSSVAMMDDIDCEAS
jgi:hypothetical protein